MGNNNSENQESKSKKKNRKVLDDASKSLSTEKNVINIAQ